MKFVPVGIVTPAVVRCHYFGFRAENGCSSVIVEDPLANIAGISFSVKTGFLNDPAAFPGLAHFCEHMLCNGSVEFPKEDEFSNYVTEHNGSYNAFTEKTSTTFFATVPEECFDGLVERFFPLFLSPLLSANCVSREVMAVNSEDVRNHSNDGWRFQEVLQSTCNKKHPASQYACGNKHTLMKNATDGEELAKQVRLFYQQHYFAGSMALAVYTSRPAANVLELISPYIARLPVGPSVSFSFSLEKGETVNPCGSWINFRTQKAGQSLTLAFEVNSPQSSSWRTKPSGYISHVLGHECDSSVFGVLKRRGLVTEMIVWPQRIDDDREELCIAFVLTDDGLCSLEEVILIFLNGIGLVLRDGIDERVYKAMNAENHLHFESTIVDSAADQCTILARGTLMADLAHCFPYSFSLEDDIEESMNYVKQLLPSRCTFSLKWGKLPIAGSEETVDRMFEKLPHFAQTKATDTSTFAGAHYSITPIPRDVLIRWEDALTKNICPELQLPQPNPFIATNLEVYPPDERGKRLLSKNMESQWIERIRTPHGATYVRKDCGFHKTFMSSIQCGVLSDCAYKTPAYAFYTKVMCGIIEESTNELRYCGTLAALDNAIYYRLLGPVIMVTGPEEHLYSFFLQLLEHLFQKSTLLATESSFTNQALRVRHDLENENCKAAYNIVLKKFWGSVSACRFSEGELLEAASGTSYKGYLEFVEEYLQSGFLYECFIAGNVKSLDDVSAKLVNHIEKNLSAFRAVSTSDLPPVRNSLYRPVKENSVKFSSPKPPLTSLDLLFFPAFLKGNKNIACVVGMYMGELTPRNAAASKCVRALLASSFFQSLRTEETLGYVVSIGCSEFLGGQYLYFLVESGIESVSGLYILSRIIAFLFAVEQSVHEIVTEDRVQEVLSSLISKLEQKPMSVKEDVQRLRGEYLSPLGFSSRLEVLNEARKLTAEDIKTFLKEKVLNSRLSRATAMIIDRCRMSDGSNEPKREEWSLPGHHEVVLPTYFKVCTESEEVPSGGKALFLPSFDASETIELVVKENESVYKKGMAELPYTSFFRDVQNNS